MTGKIENDAEKGFKLPEPRSAAELLKLIREERKTDWHEPTRPVYAEDVFKREGWQP